MADADSSDLFAQLVHILGNDRTIHDQIRYILEIQTPQEIALLEAIEQAATIEQCQAIFLRVVPHSFPAHECIRKVATLLSS